VSEEPKKRGGARPGAGRPRKAEKYAKPIADTEDRIAGRLPKTLTNLEEIADGTEQIEEEWVEKLTVVVETSEVDQDGRVHKVKKQLFPKARPGQLVLVKRKVTKIPPDFRANSYLADRIMGKPTVNAEINLSELSDDELLRALAALATAEGTD
jgi:hypothetical protein